MNWDPSFTRKVVYALLLAALAFPIVYLGLPPSRDANGQMRAGGILSQQRVAQNLAQSKLGEIDPASETMRLATFGLQGVATVFLWDAAGEYKDRSDWDNLQAVLNQLVKLQPNFLEVWRHQGWNIAYNVSVEFDDYKYRYHWVKKGLDILLEGTEYNRNDPKLLEYIGWVYGHKFGRADEHVQFRRLFRDDTDYHKHIADYGIPMDNRVNGPQAKPDNWLVAYEWYMKAQQAVQSGKPIKGTSELLFYSYPGMQRINFAEAIESEGILNESATIAWREADKAWADYAQREIPTSWSGLNIRLGELDRGGGSKRGLKGDMEDMAQKLDELAPGVRKKLVDEKRAKLTKEELKAVDTKPEDRRDPNLATLASAAEGKITVAHQEVAEAAPEGARAEARRVAEALAQAEFVAGVNERYRQIVNFGYWRLRCQIEQSKMALDGRKLLRDADKLFLVDTDFEGARKKYEEAWDNWDKVFVEDWSSLNSPWSFAAADADKDGKVTREEAPPQVRDTFERFDTNNDKVIDAQEYAASKSDDPLKQEMLTDETADTIFESIEHYRDLLEQLEEPFPRDFKLRKLLDAKGVKWHLSTAENKEATPDKKPAPPAGDKPMDKPADSPASEKKPGEKSGETQTPGEKPAEAAPEPSPNKNVPAKS